MHPIRRQRLLILIFIITAVAVAIGLSLFALRQNINLFFTPTQIALGEAPQNTLIRAGGMVVEGSVERDSQSLKVAFDITDYAETVKVRYEGILPDLFREGQGIVAQGRVVSPGEFEAVEVLAKHDENYMPPEVSDALKQAGASDQP